MNKKDIKIGLKATLKEEVWKKIGFHAAPQLYITDYRYDYKVIHKHDAPDYEFIKEVVLSMHLKGAGSWYGHPDDVELGWPVYKKEKEED